MLVNTVLVLKFKSLYLLIYCSLSYFHAYRLYKIYNKPLLRAVVYLCAWVILCLAFFETPAVSGMALPYWVRRFAFLIMIVN